MVSALLLLLSSVYIFSRNNDHYDDLTLLSNTCFTTVLELLRSPTGYSPSNVTRSSSDLPPFFLASSYHYHYYSTSQTFSAALQLFFDARGHPSNVFSPHCKPSLRVSYLVSWYTSHHCAFLTLFLGIPSSLVILSRRFFKKSDTATFLLLITPP